MHVCECMYACVHRFVHCACVYVCTCVCVFICVCEPHNISLNNDSHTEMFLM